MTDTPDHLGGHLDKVHLDDGALKFACDHAFARGKYVHQMIDVGCGPGWMRGLAEQHGIEWRGIDGDPSLRDVKDVGICDFSQREGGLGSYYDIPRWSAGIGLRDGDETGLRLAWSVEFLEHVEERFIPNFLGIFKHVDMAIVTAAPPGAPGHHHVNCRGVEYWHGVFATVGLVYRPVETLELRRRSTMVKPFMQRSGLFFERLD